MRAFSKTLVLLLLLVHASQAALVVSAPCSMVSDHAGGMDHHMSGAEHAGHDMTTDVALAAADCCEGGYCSISHCQTAPGVTSPQTPAVSETGSVLVAKIASSFVYFLPESHYRPPATG
jgi:hypothetical protein